jgi:hemolysin III
LAGVLLACVGLLVLLARATSAGRTDQIVAFGIFGLSLVALYSASTLYHLLPLSPTGVGTLRWLSVALYLGMGWVAVIAAPALFLAVPAGGMIWVLGGGLLYTAGALIYALKRPNPAPGTFGFHELWHLFVVAGSACHYWAVLRYLVPLA